MKVFLCLYKVSVGAGLSLNDNIWSHLKKRIIFIVSTFNIINLLLKSNSLTIIRLSTLERNVL